MRVSATHIVVEHSGIMSDSDYKLHKVYELSDGSYVLEEKDGLFLLSDELFYEWSNNYKILSKLKR